jgi:hypothetical protein
MSHMEQPTPNYPTTPEGKPKYTTWDGRPKNYPSQKVPGILKGPILPVWLSSRLSRPFKHTPKKP